MVTRYPRYHCIAVQNWWLANCMVQVTLCDTAVWNCWLEICTVEIILRGTVVQHCKFFRKIKTYKFSLSFYTYFQTCLPFQWSGGEILAKREDSHSESSHILPIHFKQSRLTALLSRHFDFWNWNKSIIKTLTKEQPFTNLHSDCTA
jgi:hypothetical protein